jgi:hypothetical protein
MHAPTRSLFSPRRGPVAVLAALFLSGAPAARADVFDAYTNPVLERTLEGKNVKEVKRLTPNDIIDHDRVLPGVPSALLIVRTNGNRLAKLLVQAARQRVDADRAVPILLVERFVTYKDGEEQTRHAAGKDLSLFGGFRLGLDLGQVVPEALGGDLRFVTEGNKAYAEPLGKAKLYLLTKFDPAILPKKPGKFVMGNKFDPQYFNGTFTLHDDGRRSGKLTLKVSGAGVVTGSYVSDKDGRKYDVEGKVGAPKHAIEFRVKLPRTEQTFRGMLFTGDGKAIAGSTRLADREAAFYAVRSEE